MTKEDLIRLVSAGETTFVEFKKCRNELSDAVFETVCAFLNRSGGHILLGITDRREIIGVNESGIENILKNFANIVNNPQQLNPTAYFSPEIIDVDGKKIISIYVPESSQVHRFKNKIYDRIGDADNDITLNHALIDNIYLRKRNDFTENEVCPFLTMDDLNNSTFEKARHLASVSNPTHPWLSMGNEEILHTAGFWRKDRTSGKEGFILACALLFGKEVTVLTYCPAYRTDAIYQNMSYQRYLNPKSSDPDIRYDDRDDIRVNLIEAYSRLMNFVQKHLPDRFMLDEAGIQRIDIRNKIFREVIANLLAHREYSSSFPPKLLIFTDLLITENWSKPLQAGAVTLANLETHPKNPMIAKIFKELGWVEELGSGRKNIQKYAPLYFPDYQVEIQNQEKFVFTISYSQLAPDLTPDLAPDLTPDLAPQKKQQPVLQPVLQPVQPELQPEQPELSRSTAGVKPVLQQKSESDTINDHDDTINDINDTINDTINDHDDTINDTIRIRLVALIKQIQIDGSIRIPEAMNFLHLSRSQVLRYMKILKDSDVIIYKGSLKKGAYQLSDYFKKRLNK